MLTRDEIGREPAKLIFEETKLDGITVVRHEMFTSGIGYLKVLFNTNRVPMEDLPYLGLLKSVLGYVDTKNYSYSDLSSEIFLNSGGVSFSVTSYPDLAKAEASQEFSFAARESSMRNLTLDSRSWKRSSTARLSMMKSA